jgi:capsular polysaccharide biosynthesis protein
LRNEAEIWRQLEAAGFEFFDPTNEPEAGAAFHAAEAVVGVHGAALANLAFCRPGTRVLELVPSDQCVPFYLSLSTGGGLVYDCIVGPSEKDVPRAPHSEYTSPYDFEVPPDVFAQRLAWLLLKPETADRKAAS